MSDDKQVKTKEAFLADLPDPPEGHNTQNPTPQGPVLHGNDFLRPRGNIWMWVGFLIVPFVVLLFGYAQGIFERNDDVAAEAQALEVIAEQPVQRTGDDVEGEYDPALRRRIRR